MPKFKKVFRFEIMTNHPHMNDEKWDEIMANLRKIMVMWEQELNADGQFRVHVFEGE